MDFENYYLNNETFHTTSNMRLNKIVEYARELNPKTLLDVGCGGGLLMSLIAKELPKTDIHGVDVYRSLKTKGFKYTYKSADITKGLPYKNKFFDCVTFGEVIEHVPDPDLVLNEIYRVLKPGGVLIVSTPNLVSWSNKILVLIGVQPLFTETSTKQNLGRYIKVLGQGGKVQGHLKIFTHRSLKEILELNQYEVLKRKGVTFFFPFPLNFADRFFAIFSPTASGLLYVARKKDGK